MSAPSIYAPPDLPPHCEPETPVLALLSQSFGTCLPSYLAFFSTAAGVLSIVSWLFAQIPQIWKNYRRGSVEGLSLGFLAIWLAGDVCNLLGAVWTRQMWFQQVVGLYYVLVDIVLVSQYFYFININPPELLVGHALDYDDSIDDDDNGDSDDPYLVDSEPETNGQQKKKPKEKETRSNSSGSPGRGRSRSLASTLIVVVSMMFHLAGASPIAATSAAATLDDGVTLQDLGSVLSWFSTLLYVSSRLPQLLLNLRRRSTSGLAISLFVAAFFGNFFYSLSLLLNPLGHYDYPPYGGGGIAGPDGNSRVEWWSRALPFLLGASGVLGLDAAVGWQWLVWGERAPEDSDERLEDDEEDECLVLAEDTWSRWWPWNGWFEDSPSEEEEEEEEAKPLVDDRTSLLLSYGSSRG